MSIKIVKLLQSLMYSWSSLFYVHFQCFRLYRVSQERPRHYQVRHDRKRCYCKYVQLAVYFLHANWFVNFAHFS